MKRLHLSLYAATVLCALSVHTVKAVCIQTAGCEEVTSQGIKCSDVDGKIKINSKAQLIAFAARKCTTYVGTFYVRGADDITDFELLIGLESIEEGMLYIRDLKELSSLRGFRNLKGPLADALIIRNNVKLVDLEGLQGITGVGSQGSCDEGLCMYIDDHPDLLSIKGLRGLTGTVPGGIKIQNNDALLSLDGLEGITAVTGYDEDRGFSITIEGHASLQFVTALSNISGELPGALMVWANDKLESLQGVLGIVSAGKTRIYEDGNSVYFGGNPMLCVTAAERTILQEICDKSVAHGINGLASDCAPAGRWHNSCTECGDGIGTIVSAHHPCGAGYFCDYYGGGRCMCPIGLAGVGCTTATSKVWLISEDYKLIEPSASSSTQDLHVQLRRSTSTVSPTAIVLTQREGAGFTATAEEDYKITGALDQVTWTNATHGYILLQLEIVADSVYESVERFAVGIGPHPDLYADCELMNVGDDATVNIRDAPSGIARFGRAEQSISEDSAVAFVELQRVGGSAGTMVLELGIYSGRTTATSGDDYAFSGAKVVWDNGDTTPKAVAVPLVNDDVYESPDKILTLHIDSIMHPDMRGVALQETAIIIQDEGDAGFFKFANATHTSIDGLQPAVRVGRFGGSSTSVSVIVRLDTSFKPREGAERAEQGKHLDFTEQVLTWGDGELGYRDVVFVVTPAQNSMSEHSFRLQLAAAPIANGASLSPSKRGNCGGSESSTIINIRGVSPAGSLAHFLVPVIGVCIAIVLVLVVGLKKNMAMKALLYLMKDWVILGVSIAFELADIISDIYIFETIILGNEENANLVIWYGLFCGTGTCIFLFHSFNTAIYLLLLQAGVTESSFARCEKEVTERTKKSGVLTNRRIIHIANQKDCGQDQSVAYNETTGEKLTEMELKMEFMKVAHETAILELEINRTFGILALLILEDIPMVIINLILLNGRIATKALLLSQTISTMLIAFSCSMVYSLISQKKLLKQNSKTSQDLLDEINELGSRSITSGPDSKCFRKV